MPQKNSIKKDAFYPYVKKNNLERIGHGIYISEDVWPDELFILHKYTPHRRFFSWGGIVLSQSYRPWKKIY